MRLRKVQDDDWPAILALANAAVAHVTGAGSQQAWLDNRRSFDRAHGSQVQYVCEQGGAIAGYGAVEGDARGEWRMFIVVEPHRLPTVGSRLYGCALTVLRAMNVGHVWFTEYAQDEPLRSFAHERGFVDQRRMTLPAGPDVIVMRKLLQGWRDAALPVEGEEVQPAARRSRPSVH